ncbi:hypothetical protein [Arthrobacter rhombi]|uniref:hypothetical protein n=1 Tax=Arthrobacter rhombi TaxID=71253 RepID=UPI003FD03E58
MTADYVWTPLGASSDELTEFLSLRPGIPGYMRESVLGWIRNGKSGREMTGSEFLVQFQTASKTNLGISAGMRISHDEMSKFLRSLSGDIFSNLVHFILSELVVNQHGDSGRRAERLEAILSTGGSSYAVGMVQGRYGLVERMPTAVVDTVESVISSASKASSLLSKAWELAFGMNKSPSHAYIDAIKAVEVFSGPLFSPNDSHATLGKDINVLRTGEANFEFVMIKSGNSTSLQHVLSMMQLLWHSQTDRHGDANYESVSAEEAQSAVLLASTLVGWFSKGMVSRKNT